MASVTKGVITYVAAHCTETLDRVCTLRDIDDVMRMYAERERCVYERNERTFPCDDAIPVNVYVTQDLTGFLIAAKAPVVEQDT